MVTDSSTHYPVFRAVQLEVKYAAKADIHRPFENVDDPKDAIL